MRTLLSTLTLAACLVAPAAPAADAEIGQPAPAFELRDEAGKVHRLADYKGKVVVLEWTNPECPFVQRHYAAKTMTRTLAQFPGRPVIWLAIDSTAHNTPAKSAAWKTQEGFTYPVLQDAAGTTGKAYGAKTTPHLYVIDAAGVLRYNGAIDDDPRGKATAPTPLLKQALEAVLAGKSPPSQSNKPYGCSVKYGSN